ncbi:MAG TPA: hypothetical protein VGK21_05395, partial [Candidatus Angelobacter sp.]
MTTIAALCRLELLLLADSFMADNPMPRPPFPSKIHCSMRFITVAIAVLFLVFLVAPAASSGIVESKSSTSTVVDFSPAAFVVKAEAKFFYSIDNELKYSNQIDPHAPTLTRGPVANFLVSPDGSKIAIVVRKRLLIVGTESVLGEVAKVDSIFRTYKPIGRRFFREDGFQWSRDSKSLYLIRDEYYRSRGLQLFSKNGELWRYDLNSRSLHLILKPFRAYSYFFGPNSRIYYSEPADGGDLQLKFFDGHNSTNIDKPNAADIPELPDEDDKGPFYSFSVVDYEKALPYLNVTLARRDGVQELFINDKKYLSVTQGKGWDGYYYCLELLRSVFLPGDKFFLLNVPFCGNYRGQLLFDLESGQYQELPPHTVVFSTLNTMTFKHYR